MMTDEEKFMEDLYDEANEDLKEVYKKQKEVRDKLLKEIALIMLTYSILDGLMSIGKSDKDKSYKKLSSIVLNGHKNIGKNQINTISNILSYTVNKTFNYYSYNSNLKDVKEIIDDNFKGKHFSERVWDNEQETAKRLHKQVNDFLNGKVNVNQIKKDIEKTYNTSAYNSKRLVETEVNRCSTNAFDRFCIETGVEKVRYNATLDSKLCSDCSQYHDKIFDLNEKIEVPRHPLCRCFYTIEDDIKDKDEFINEKQGKDVDSQVNWDLVDSDDYKNKFNDIGENSNVDNEMYNISKRILKHRDGTKFEDLYVVDLKTGKTVTYITQDTEMGIRKTDKLERILNRNNKEYIIIHNHPHSSPFSESDLKTLFNSNSVNKMMAIGHDGTVFKINSINMDINIEKEYKKYYNLLKSRGFSDFTSMDRALELISNKFNLGYERS